MSRFVAEEAGCFSSNLDMRTAVVKQSSAQSNSLETADRLNKKDPSDWLVGSERL